MDTIYWIWLSLAVTPGGQTFGKLLTRFDTAKAVFDATDDELSSVITSKSKDYRALCDKTLDAAESILDFCNKKSVGILTYADESYPRSYRNIPSPPVLLYYRGTLPDFNTGCYISVVGTRRLTDYGRRNGFTIAYDLACAGAILVSGMAIGIDGVCHAGSLSAGGINVAFLGSGIDICYPPQHLKLAKEIVKNGCILTEYPPHSKPEKQHFPIRNRLIAALSCAAVVIEGRERSGSLITARFAREFGKTVYALPGNVDNKTSEASNLLIKNGARLITSADDIVNDLENVYLGIINPFKLLRRPGVNMENVFRDLEISCVTAGDGIFGIKRTKKAKVRTDAASEDHNDGEAAKLPPDERTLDDTALHVYRRIPVDADIAIDEIPDDTVDMKKVMRALLKLEMGCFVTMLPGERVKRNI